MMRLLKKRATPCLACRPHAAWTALLCLWNISTHDRALHPVQPSDRGTHRSDADRENTSWSLPSFQYSPSAPGSLAWRLASTPAHHPRHADLQWDVPAGDFRCAPPNPDRAADDHTGSTRLLVHCPWRGRSLWVSGATLEHPSWTGAEVKDLELGSLADEMMATICTRPDADFVKTVEDGLRHYSDYIAAGTVSARRLGGDQSRSYTWNEASSFRPFSEMQWNPSAPKDRVRRNHCRASGTAMSSCTTPMWKASPIGRSWQGYTSQRGRLIERGETPCAGWQGSSPKRINRC